MSSPLVLNGNKHASLTNSLVILIFSQEISNCQKNAGSLGQTPHLCQRYNPLAMNLEIKLPRSIFDNIITQARDERPQECCGLIGGRNLQASNRYPLRNRSPQPETRYFAAPEDLFEAMKWMRDADEDLIGIYHSHPCGPAYPPQTDIELAFYPQAVYLIVTLEPETEMRAFHINAREVIEIAIVVVD